MKTLTEIKNQTMEEKIKKIQKVVNRSFKKPFEVDERCVRHFEDLATEKDYILNDHIAEYNGFRIYEVEIEIANHSQGKGDYTQHLTCYIADNIAYNPDNITVYVAF